MNNDKMASGSKSFLKPSRSVVKKLLELRQSGQISDEVFAYLIRLYISNYVQYEVSNRLNKSISRSLDRVLY